MAKETKLMREHRLAEEQLARVEEERVNYLPRLMRALETASKLNYALEVKEGKFVVYDRNERKPESFHLTAEYSETNQNRLSDLEWKVDYAAREQAEADRKFLVKQVALTKLSKEERELLGV